MIATVIPSTVIDDVFIDLDGVTADFDKALKTGGHTGDKFKVMVGSYLWLDLVEGALESIELLRRMFPGNGRGGRTKHDKCCERS